MRLPTRERAVSNAKFKVGQMVDFNPARPAMPVAREYKILRLLPMEGREQQYRIKSIAELFERIARESELSFRT